MKYEQQIKPEWYDTPHHRDAGLLMCLTREEDEILRRTCGLPHRVVIPEDESMGARPRLLWGDGSSLTLFDKSQIIQKRTWVPSGPRAGAGLCVDFGLESAIKELRLGHAPAVYTNGFQPSDDERWVLHGTGYEDIRQALKDADFGDRIKLVEREAKPDAEKLGSNLVDWLIESFQESDGEWNFTNEWSYDDIEGNVLKGDERFAELIQAACTYAVEEHYGHGRTAFWETNVVVWCTPENCKIMGVDK